MPFWLSWFFAGVLVTSAAAANVSPNQGNALANPTGEISQNK